MGPQKVFLDANILFSRTLRDWFFQLRLNSQGDLFTVATSEEAIVEVQSRLRKENPGLSGQVVSRFRNQVTDFCDEFASEYLVPEIREIADEQDWHIHAAVLKLSSDILITSDKGFLTCREVLQESYNYEILHPDEFLVLVDDNWPSLVRRVTDLQSIYWAEKELHSGAKSRKLATMLSDAKCPAFAARVQQHLKALSGA